MQPGPLRWIVLFFTRPIRLADLTAMAHALKRRPKPAAVPVAEDEDEKPARRSSSRPRLSAAAKPRPATPVVRDASLDLAVSEQPFDTLPAELQSEFGISAPAALDALAPPAGPAGRVDG